jgi:hypothetical protein
LRRRSRNVTLRPSFVQVTVYADRARNQRLLGGVLLLRTGSGQTRFQMTPDRMTTNTPAAAAVSPVALDEEKERRRLELVAAGYDPSNPAEEFDYYTKRLHVEVLLPRLQGGGPLLEMGCATGELSSLLAPHIAGRYEIVEGSAYNARVTKERVPQAALHLSLWETFTPPHAYADILLVCGLEHVAEPVGLLRLASSWLSDGGRLHLIVPNAESIHRHVGVAMGMLPRITALSESDHRIGHRRVYTPTTLVADVEAAGLVPSPIEGILLKPVSNRQMLGWEWPLIYGLFVAGQRHPEMCAEMYLTCTHAR